MFVKSKHNLVSACHQILKITARHGKPPSDGSYIKESWLVCAPYVFEDFPTNDKKSISADFVDFLI